METVMRKIFGLLPLCLLLLPAAPAAAQPASLVADLNTTLPGSFGAGAAPRQLLPVGDKLFFSAYDPRSGETVWSSDGTAAGTEMLADTCLGECGSTPWMLGTTRGLAFWQASDESNGPELLWRSDGTRVGTFPVLTSLSIPSGSYAAFLGGVLYITGCDPEHGCELWRSDGTAAGTTLVKDILPGEADGRPNELAVLGNRLFFIATDPASAKRALWKTDGTGAGTSLVKELDDKSDHRWMQVAGDKLLFHALVSPERRELWASDGTPAGTRPITQLSSTPYNSFMVTVIGGRGYFVADDGTNGNEIWRSDGTPAGTVRLTDVAAPFVEFGGIAELGGRLIYAADTGPSGFKVYALGGSPASAVELCSDCAAESALFRIGEKVVFMAQDGLHGREPWVTDGTPAGTRMIRDTCPGDCDGMEEHMPLIPAAGAVFFLGHDRELWRIDGTVAGTRRFTELARPNLFGSIGPLPAVAAIGQTLFFSGGGSSYYGAELWKSDGRPGGTRMVADAVHSMTSSIPTGLVPFGEQVLFTACDGDDTEIWRSAGTAASTLRVTSSPEDGLTCNSSLTGPVVAGNRILYWYSSRSTDGEEAPELQLWSAGDTPGSSPRLLTSFKGWSYSPATLYPFRGKALFFLQVDRPSGPDLVEVWLSDGTPQGTGKVFDLPAEVTRIEAVHVLGDEVYWVALTWTASQVWRSDGTDAGTRLIAAAGTAPTPQFARLGSTVLFNTRVENIGDCLWKTDGTAAGTTLVKDLPDNSYFGPGYLTSWKGAVYFFSAAAQPFGRALWRSDGTEAGTRVVRELGLGADQLTVFGERLLFAANDAVHGYELWQSDGTEAGTSMVRDILPGPNGSYPYGLVAASGRLFFAATEGVHGRELWQSDGTEAGTRQVQDIAPGPVSSHPRDLTVAGSSLFFSADDGYTGRELWTLPLAAPAGCQPSPRHLCLGGGRFRVEARWRDFEGRAGQGTAVPLTADTGYFWFFGPDNVEVVLKVLDGQGINGHHWVFYGALSSVEYALTVTDTQTGASVRYFNPAGQTASVGDVTGFGRLGAFSTKTVEKTAPPSPPALIAERFDPAAIGPCQAGTTRLCLNGGRFAVEASWKAQGRNGVATAVPLTSDTGCFWFFDDDNVEVMLKVLDGRPINGKFWVFYGALSNVEYTLTVTDTQTGQVKTYANPNGRFASVGDTAAF